MRKAKVCRLDSQKYLVSVSLNPTRKGIDCELITWSEVLKDNNKHE